MKAYLHHSIWTIGFILLAVTSALAQLMPNPSAVQQSTGLNGAVTAMTVYDGKLVIAGNFTDADGMPCKGLVTWNGTAFDTIPGTPGFRTHISGGNRINTLLQAENSLYVGGNFPTLDTDSGFASVGHIIRYTGAGWQRMLTNTTHPAARAASGPVKSLVFHEDKLYVGGDFTTVDVNGDNIQAGHLATYDWNSTPLWKAVGTDGLSGNSASAEAMTLWNNRVLVAGRFEAGDSIPSRNMVIYDEVLGFISINTGTFTAQVGRARCLAIQNGKVYVGGDFNNIGQNNLFGLNAYDGTNWLNLNADIGIDRRALYACDEDYVWVGGQLDGLGASVNNLYVYDVMNDSVLPFSSNYWGVDGIVNAMVEYNGELYIAGEFNYLQGSNGHADMAFKNILKVSGFCGSLTGINEVNSESGLRLYPNPANNFVTIDNIPKSSKLMVFDISGKVVYSFFTKTESTTINTSDFVNGIYILTIMENTGTTVKKLIISR
ncbi:MAG: T9SS type A sorting domain-containing protein [Owenweeksia sp.]|nr:T9SS type A sorting domain-containing protein [Owenweeksia sp.]